MGGGGGSRTQDRQVAQIPDEYKPLINTGVNKTIPAVDASSLTAFLGPNPQTIPGLTDAERAVIDAIYGVGQKPYNDYQTQAGNLFTQQGYQPFTPAQQAALFGTGQLAGAPETTQQTQATDIAMSLAGGPLGESPATKAAQAAWRKNTLPQLRQDEAMRGQFYSGAGIEAEENSFSDVTQKSIAQEVENRARMAPVLAGIGRDEFGQALGANQQMGNMGATQFGQTTEAGKNLMGAGTTFFDQQINALQEALKAAGMPREISGQQAQAIFNDFLRQQGLNEALTLGVTGSFLPSTFGQTSIQKTTPTK